MALLDSSAGALEDYLVSHVVATAEVKPEAFEEDADCAVTGQKRTAIARVGIFAEARGHRQDDEAVQRRTHDIAGATALPDLLDQGADVVFSQRDNDRAFACGRLRDQPAAELRISQVLVDEPGQLCAS